MGVNHLSSPNQCLFNGLMNEVIIITDNDVMQDGLPDFSADAEIPG